MTGGTRAIKELSLRDYKFYSKLIPLCFAVSLPYLPPPRASSRPDHERSPRHPPRSPAGRGRLSRSPLSSSSWSWRRS